MSIRVMTKVWASSRAKGGPLLILLAIADAANDAGESWPSVGSLAEKSRLSPRQVQYAVRRLAVLGELAVERRSGRYSANLYRVLVGAAPEGCKDCTPREPQGVQRLHPRGVQSSVSRGAIHGAPTIRPVNRTRAETTPPTPPRGGGVDGRGAEKKTAGASASADRPAIAPADPVARVDAAYREVFGHAMPHTWDRRLGRDAAAGGAVLFAGCTAADIQAAVALAERRKRTFGLGWLRVHLERQAAARVRAEAEVARHRQDAAAVAAATDAGPDLAEAARERDAFRALPEAEQDRWRREARREAIYAGMAAGPGLDREAARLAAAAAETTVPAERHGKAVSR